MGGGSAALDMETNTRGRYFADAQCVTPHMQRMNRRGAIADTTACWSIRSI